MVLVDANVIVRLLVKDHQAFFLKALEFFQTNRAIYVEESVLAECYYVMTKFYKIEKEKVLEDLRQLLLLPNVQSDEVFRSTFDFKEQQHRLCGCAFMCTGQNL